MPLESLPFGNYRVCHLPRTIPKNTDIGHWKIRISDTEKYGYQKRGGGSWLVINFVVQLYSILWVKKHLSGTEETFAQTFQWKNCRELTTNAGLWLCCTVRWKEKYWKRYHFLHAPLNAWMISKILFATPSQFSQSDFTSFVSFTLKCHH